MSHLPWLLLFYGPVMVRHGALLVKPDLGHLRAMSSEPLFFRLRLPERVKDQIEAAALENNRSMNAEVLARLERSFSMDETTLESRVDDLELIGRDMDKRFDRLESNVARLLERAGLYDPNPD